MTQNEIILTEEKFLNLLAEAFKDCPEKIANPPDEKKLQIYIANILLDAGFKVFCEYPYPQNKDKCDLVVTEKNPENVTHWIEIKPFGKEWLYCSPSKFFEEVPFMEDVRKLYEIRQYNGSRESRYWFVVAASSEDEVKFVDVGTPFARKPITISQMAKAVSRWAKKEPFVKKIGQNGYALLWSIGAYEKIEFKPINGTFELG